MTGGKSGGKASGSKNAQSYVIPLCDYMGFSNIVANVLIGARPRLVSRSPLDVFTVCFVRATMPSVLVLVSDLFSCLMPCFNT